MTDRAGLPVLRTEVLKPPCEKSHIGCAKGHWSKPIQLTAGDRKLIDLFEASMASGGSMLTEAERKDEILKFVFSLLYAHYESAKRASLLAAAANIIALVSKR